MRQRNKFLTVVFSFLPGAGHMFMGFMKRGVSLMSAFFFIIFVSSWLNIGPLLFVLPVLWFYAFFDSINILYAPWERFSQMEDGYLFSLQQYEGSLPQLIKKQGVLLGSILIFFGGYLLLENILGTFNWHAVLPNGVVNGIYSVLRLMPQMLICGLIIALGVWLIIGKRKELKEDD